MRIAILGSGYVASAYARALLFLGYHPMIISRAWLDYTDPMALKEFLGHYKPAVLINAAGFTGRTVDDCEIDENKPQCYHSHIYLAHNIVKACHGTGIKLIHISTGCLFSGPGPYTEEDHPDNGEWLDGSGLLARAPFYIACKWLAEKAVSTYELAYTFRIRMPFNHEWNPRNLLVKLCNHPRILDGNNSLTFLDEFCMRSWMLVGKSAPGVYNGTYGSAVTILEVARMLYEEGLREEKVSAYPPEQFLLDGHVRRSEAVLDATKFEKAFGATWGDPLAAIRWCIERMKEKRPIVWTEAA